MSSPSTSAHRPTDTHRESRKVQEMKAIRIHAFGGPEVLAYEEVSRPIPGDDEVLVKVHAASVNPVDVATRAGYLQGMIDIKLPHTPGLDLAGVVEAVGADVTSVAVGDQVYAYSNIARQGAYAEYAVVSAGEVARKPKTVDFVNAASIPLAGITAWQALKIAGVQQGQTVLIHGAGGGTGSFAVQFAHVQGARVIATASTDKAAYLKTLGADEVIDYTATRFEDVVRDVDVVVDLVGGDVTARSLGVLKPGGTFVTPIGQPDQAAAAAAGVTASSMFAQASVADLTEIASLIDAGRVKTSVSHVFPLAEARAAQELLERGHMQGKIVLQVAE